MLKNISLIIETPTWAPSWISNVIYLDHLYSIRINSISKNQFIQRFFSVISKIGDGSIWYISCLSLPIYTYLAQDSKDLALIQFLQLALFAISGTVIYKAVKFKTNRPRPFIQHTQITLGCAPLDKWSFPSGHTLHAVGNTILLTYHMPLLGYVFIPFACLVAASRPILGLHFPSDVLMGAIIGAVVSSSMTYIF